MIEFITTYITVFIFPFQKRDQARLINPDGGRVYMLSFLLLVATVIYIIAIPTTPRLSYLALASLYILSSVQVFFNFNGLLPRNFFGRGIATFNGGHFDSDQFIPLTALKPFARKLAKIIVYSLYIFVILYSVYVIVTPQ